MQAISHSRGLPAYLVTEEVAAVIGGDPDPIEGWVREVSPVDLAVAVEHGRPLLPGVGVVWQSEVRAGALVYGVGWLGQLGSFWPHRDSGGEIFWLSPFGGIIDSNSVTRPLPGSTS